MKTHFERPRHSARVKRIALTAAFGFACMMVSPATLRAADLTAASGGDEATISKALQDSAIAWSRGDLVSFMHCYEDSPDTAYVKSAGLVQGYAAIHDMYASRYGAGSGHAMGRLSLQMMNYRQLGQAYGLVTGRFALARSKAEGGDASGVFTLVFHRNATGWHIIYDHTS